MIDYLDKGNRLVFEYVLKWAKVGPNISSQVQTYNLTMLLG